MRAALLGIAIAAGAALIGWVAEPAGVLPFAFFGLWGTLVLWAADRVPAEARDSAEDVNGDGTDDAMDDGIDAAIDDSIEDGIENTAEDAAADVVTGWEAEPDLPAPA
ncbi:MAG TPA: hypothetical protein VH912_33495 [Streptosporangiaceae bacterium]|jgi:hypothetical protein